MKPWSYGLKPRRVNNSVTTPVLPIEPMKAKASGTPPVLASTPQALVTSRRNSRLGRPDEGDRADEPDDPGEYGRHCGQLEARDVVVQVGLARIEDRREVGERQAAGVVAERLDHHRGGGDDQEQPDKDEKWGDADDGQQASRRCPGGVTLSRRATAPKRFGSGATAD